MLDFSGSNLVRVVADLQGEQGTLYMESDALKTRQIDGLRLFAYMGHAEKLDGLIRPFGIRGLNDQLARYKELTDGQPTPSELYYKTHALLTNVADELKAPLFFYVPPIHRQLYEDPFRWYGVQAVKAFPSTHRDVLGAAKCLAVGQGTATVFHAMRVLEVGLWYLGARLGIKKSSMKDWGPLLGLIEKKIEEMQLAAARGGTTSLKARSHLYSELAAEFRHFKDAWRNYVAHAKESYEIQDAERVLIHVRDFMTHLASRKRVRV